MANEFTPGPWGWEFFDTRRIALSNKTEDVLIVTADLNDHPLIDTSEANANLIAAAPDLLEACIEFAAYANCECGDDGPYKDSKCAVCLASTAIAKARREGEAQDG